MNINPDAGINVVAVFPDGTATVYEGKPDTAVVRRRLYTKKFTCYGKAVLWASEFETQGRAEKLKRGR